jgi:rubrerythrin
MSAHPGWPTAQADGRLDWHDEGDVITHPSGHRYRLVEGIWVLIGEWRCPRCETTVETREAGPRCPRCGFAEGS